MHEAQAGQAGAWQVRRGAGAGGEASRGARGRIIVGAEAAASKEEPRRRLWQNQRDEQG